ncbi:phenoloxidase 2-like isoform X2 [Schistocerca gregaria]|nr:phenoloxidase 2-like isoform X2 [Schistocerca gregaria]
MHLLMEHLHEPVSFLKGVNRNYAFKVPVSYLNDRIQKLNVVDRSGFVGDVQEIQVKQITPPDLSIPLELGHDENFSQFLPKHRRIAARLIEILMDMPNREDFLSASVFCRERLNPYLYIYALSVAILHRPDTRDVGLPSLIGVFPHKFVNGEIFTRVRQEANAVPPGSRVPIEIPQDFTASDLEPEHRVAYFREDIGINLFHWHWHLVYPFEGPLNIVNKDRRGELFYYLHKQLVARYNFERLSNHLGRVRKLNNWHKPLKEAYFPKLDNMIASRVWPARHEFAKLQDINRELDQLSFDIQDMERFRDRIFEAIHRKGALNERGEVVNLTSTIGIDILGNMVESSILSINRNFYGDLHNLGHLVIALCHDPDGRHLETFGVIGDPATAMRDPLFYRWHAYIDHIFQQHKILLPPYTVEQLDFPGVVVSGMQLISENAERNEFATFWQKNDVDLSRGLDFTPRGSVFARFTHLQHAPYVFLIQVDNSGPTRMGTMRIFLAPKFDERRRPMLLRDQRHLFIELDKFTVQLRPGRNVFQRSSNQSSVTIPFERTFRNLTNPDPANQAEFNYCGCGWPDHMLIPKGNTDGLPADLFVMVSDYTMDRVEQPAPEGCQQAHSYCGLRDRLYPDRRPMGYPLDRLPRAGVNTLYEFITPNMGVLNVKIRFQDKILPPFERQ